jgi:TetR/AcrR family fatty acid metabolism transcriptional regulator
MSEIANRAEMSVGSLYVYFKSKDDLLIEIFKNYFDELMGNVEKIFTETEQHPLDKLFDGLNLVVNTLSDDKDMAKVFLVELRQSNKALESIAPEIRNKYENLIKNLIDEAKKKELVRKNIDPELIGLSTFGLIESILFDWINKEYSKKRLLRKLEKAANYFIQGIRK